MPNTTRAKQERIIEAVRHGLEGDAAVDFIHQSGFAMTTSGIARHLRAMGGRGRVQELINNGRSNLEVLKICFPEEDFDHFAAEPPSQGDLFEGDEPMPGPSPIMPQLSTRRINIRLPEDLYEAIRLAAKAERKSQNDLIVDILTSALSQVPGSFGPEPEEDD